MNEIFPGNRLCDDKVYYYQPAPVNYITIEQFFVRQSDLK
jgi:hypothetical protein